MRIISNKYFEIITQSILVTIPFILPAYSLHNDIGTVLSVVSLLFGILIGFFIATATSKHFNLQRLISQESALLMSLHSNMKLISDSDANNIADAIDAYVIAQLDYEALDHLEHTEKEFKAIVDIVNTVSLKATNDSSQLQSTMSSLIEVHEEMHITVQKVVTNRHWYILLPLSVIIATTLLSLRDGSLVFSILCSITMLAIYQALHLLYQLDTNLFLAERLAYKSPQRIFKAIEKMTYYPKYAIDMGYVRNLKAPYRVGTYTNYPKSLDKNITVVNESAVA